MFLVLTWWAMTALDGLLAFVAMTVRYVWRFGAAAQHADVVLHRPSPVAAALEPVALLGVVQPTVLGGGDNRKVLNAIVRPVPVDVVNVLVGGQVTAKHRLNHKAVFGYIAVLCGGMTGNAAKHTTVNGHLPPLATGFALAPP